MIETVVDKFPQNSGFKGASIGGVCKLALATDGQIFLSYNANVFTLSTCMLRSAENI